MLKGEQPRFLVNFYKPILKHAVNLRVSGPHGCHIKMFTEKDHFI
jgi:hypothetical protein